MEKFFEEIREQVGILHAMEAIDFCEYEGNIVKVEHIVGGVAVTYKSGKTFNYIRANG